MKIIFSKRFQKRYKKLPKNLREQFDKRIDLFKENSNNPILCDHALKGNFLGLRAFSVSGDCRVTYKMLDEKVIYLGDIGKHSQIYE